MRSADVPIDDMWTWTRAVLGVIGAVVVVGGGLWMVSSWTKSCENVEDHWPRERFDSAKWQSTSPLERYKFVYDLTNRGVLRRKTREEVEALLGRPGGVHQATFAYVIKAGCGDVNVHSYRVNFGSDGRVEAYGAMKEQH